MKKRVLALLTVFFLMLSNVALAYPRVTNYDSYYNEVNIGLKSMMSTSIGINLTGDYNFGSQKLIGGTSYTISLNSGKISFNGNLYSEITLTPVNSGNLLKLTSGTVQHYYHGSITFKVLSGKIIPINKINIEEYLKGVVGREMSNAYPIEALKAQAVAARNYALINASKHRAEGFGLCDTIDCQVYKGYDAKDDNVMRAVEATRGRVLLYGNELVNAYYSASNGGYVEKCSNVWNEDVPYLQDKADPYERSPYTTVNWSSTLSNSQIDKTLKSKNIISSKVLYFAGSWTEVPHSSYSGGHTNLSNTQGSYVEFTFNGTSFNWIGYGGYNTGIAKVSIDGGAPFTVDTYYASSLYKRVLYTKNLSPGTHKIKIEVTGTKNPKSSASTIHFDAFDYSDGSKTIRYEDSTLQFIKIDLSSISKYTSGRVSKISVSYRDINGGVIIKNLYKEGARTFLGLKSSMYDVKYDSATGNYTFYNGKGNGHGIGMSQIGARNRANAGQAYSSILTFYYGSTSVYSVIPYIKNVSMSNSKVLAGQNVNVTTQSAGGSSQATLYKYELRKDGALLNTRPYSTDANYTYNIGYPGQYTVTSYVKDSLSGAEYDDKDNMTFTAYTPWEVIRLSGSDRYGTALSISKKGWTQSDYAVVATGKDFPDALSASPLAKKYDAPILLTNNTLSDTNLFNELNRLQSKKVFIIGGSKVVSTSIESKIKSMGVEVIRISGSDRFGTSLNVAKYMGSFSEIVVATGMNYPDALTVAPIAASKGMPIILVSKYSVSSSIKSYLSEKTINKSYIIGQTGVISDTVKNQFNNSVRIGGKTRFETNAGIIKTFKGDISFENVFVARGLDFPDALTGSALAGKTASPIILIEKQPEAAIKSLINENVSSIKNMYVLGGTKVIPDSAIRALVN